jgi:hypothetical protein
VNARTVARIEHFAAEHFAGRYTRLDIRFRGQFCYIDACTGRELAVSRLAGDARGISGVVA